MYWDGMQRCIDFPAQAQTIIIVDRVWYVRCAPEVLGEKVLRRGTSACVAERQKPVCDQRGSVQCLKCQRWFGAKGDKLSTNVVQKLKSSAEEVHTKDLLPMWASMIV